MGYKPSALGIVEQPNKMYTLLVYATLLIVPNRL